MKRPLGLVIICFALGIVTGDLASVTILWWLLPGLALAVACVGSARAGPWLLPVLLFASGAANLALNQQSLSPHDLRKLTPPEPILVSVRGEIERVDLRAAVSGDDETLRASARVRVSALADGSAGWRPAHGWVLASTRVTAEPPVRAGQHVELTGVLKPPPEAFARGMFDYRAHLARRAIHRQLEFEGERDVRVLTASPPAWSARFQAWAMGVLGQGFAQGDPAIGMLWALCVGWLVPLTDEVSEPFMRSGTMHLFAISGQHVALIAGILVALLRLVRIPRRAVGWVVIPVLWFYTAATGWQPSAIRSTIMMSVIILGWTLERPVDLLNSLGAAALLILVWDPQQLFQAGFQLSFAVVASIGLLLPPLEHWRQKLLRTDPLLPAELRPVWQQRLDAPLRFVTLSLAVSLAAWLGSLPLIMAYFHLFTPVGLVANLVVVQFGSLALASALGSLLCWPFAPWLTELFNHAAWFFAHAMAGSSEWFSELPGAWCYVKAPPLECIGCYYAALWLVMSGRLWRSWRWAAPLAASLAAGMVASWHLEHRDARLSVLPLNGGHALFLEQPWGENWLIDCGDEVTWRFRTRPFLQARGVNRVDNLVLTHGDIRHIGAATNVLAEFAPRRIVLNPGPQRSPAYRQLIPVAADLELKVVNASAGDVLEPWTVIHPVAGDTFAKADSSALVMQLNLAGRKILHAPDLDVEGWRRWVERETAVEADILVASPVAGGRALADVMERHFPDKDLIVVDTEFPATERLSEAIRNRLAARRGGVRFTSEAGVIELRFRRGDSGPSIADPPRKREE